MAKPTIDPQQPPSRPPQASVASAPSDRARAVILSRRARFVGLAMASVGIAATASQCAPAPTAVCLSPPAETNPEVVVPAPDAALDGGDVSQGTSDDAGATPGAGETDAGTPRTLAGQDGGRPAICLSIMPRRDLMPRPDAAAPQICLSDDPLDGNP